MALRVGSEYGDKQFWLSNKIHIKIDPFGPDKFKFVYFEVDEWIGGRLPEGKLQLRATELPAQDKVMEKTNFFTFTIEQDEPTNDKYEIYCFIKHREWSPENGEFLVEFVCVPNTSDGKNGKFYTKTKRKKFKKKKIKDVIKETWEDNSPPRFRWKTDADPPPEDWFQDRWHDLEFLRRLCVSVKMISRNPIGLQQVMNPINLFRTISVRNIILNYIVTLRMLVQMANISMVAKSPKIST